MSTPESPGELRLGASQVPTTTEIPRGTAPTPGVALAAARVPGGPSVPDAEPIALTALIQRYANELFTAPPASVAPVSATTSTAAPTVPVGAPVASAPLGAEAAPPTSAFGFTDAIAPPSAPATAPSAPTAAPTTPAAPSADASPFTSPLRFDALGDLGALPLISFPLLDDTTTPALAPPAATPEPDHALAYELVPTDRPSLGPIAGTGFDPHALRREFPILNERVNGKRLVWLDNAATTQKPQAVIDRLKHFYEHENSNIHRAAHTLAARATDAYESARESVRRFLNAPSVKDIVFVRGATEGINLIAQAWGRANVKAGDEIVVTHLEHHANIVPWQQLCLATGAVLKVAPVDDDGQIILAAYEQLLGPKTVLVAMTQVSNALGTITPARAMIEAAHRHGAVVVLDGAQAVSHMPVDVQALDCDFFVFSGHKVFAPTGIGAVYGKRDLLEAMPPWQGGGNMISDVTFERTTFHGPPMRFEAGTGNIADAVGLGAALDWLMRIGVANVGHYEHELLGYGTARLATVPGLRMIGTARDKAGVLSFTLAGQKTEQVGGMLDQEGIAVRSGHHCAQPILRRFGVEATVRASLAPYNTCEDLDALVAALHRIQVGR